ncbi:MAG: MFS transporter [Burkholderiales bacterium]|nr:MFS transporter [Burkholderiales bacterium]
MNQDAPAASAGRAAQPSPEDLIDSPYAALRLGVTLILMTIGGCGMYVVAVALPAVQAEFGVARADASLPYTLQMIGFGVGGVLMGRLADRFGIMVPIIIGGVCLGLGFVAAGMATSIWGFILAHGVLLGLLGSSATFAPLIADTSLWFVRRRGIAVAICASGNYLAGTVWPPIVQHFIASLGWRETYFWLAGISCLSMLALAPMMRRRPPMATVAAPGTATLATHASDRPFGFTPGQAQALLCVAGVACCVAMSMPQVHIVAYCGDLGYGAARGAQMLSLMLGFGIVSRLISGAICDRIGGMRTLLLGSALQGVALLFFLPFDSLLSLYIVSAMFGLFQGGIVPAYAIIVREYFAPKEAGARVGTVIMCTLLGMALGGWMSGKVFDLTGSYHAAFVNGVVWNLVNLGIVLFLFARVRRLGTNPPSPRSA